MVLLVLQGVLMISGQPALAQALPAASISAHLRLGFDLQPGATPFGTNPPFPVIKYMADLEAITQKKTPPSRTVRKMPDTLSSGIFLEQLQDLPTTTTFSPGKVREMVNKDIPGRVDVSPDKQGKRSLDMQTKDELMLAELSFFQDIENHVKALAAGDRTAALLIVKKWQMISRNHPDSIESVTRGIAGYHKRRDFQSYIDSEVAKH